MTLTAVHDKRQAVQRKEYAFVPARRRSHMQTLPPASPPGGCSGGGISTKAPSAAGGAAALLGLDGPVAEDELAQSDGLIGIAQLGRFLRGARSAGSSAGWCAAGCRGLEMQEPAGADGQRWWGIDQDVGRTRPA
jgi:hypothetical protein